MSTHDKIELPPLPRPQVPDIDLLDIHRLAIWCEKTAKDYAIAAVEADRQRRGEPVTVRKAFICAACDGVYSDQPVSRCDCMPENNEFIEGTIIYPAINQPDHCSAPGRHQPDYRHHDIAAWLRRRANGPFVALTGNMANEIADILESK